MLLFALASLTARRRRRDIAVYGLLFLALLDASLPRSILVGPLLSLVAPFKMAEPGRAMLIACLPLGLLAGMGLDATLSPSGARSKTVRTVVLALFGGHGAAGSRLAGPITIHSWPSRNGRSFCLPWPVWWRDCGRVASPPPRLGDGSRANVFR